jgi:membrane-bound acyltransferase YfiQ involved in biofilm formation
MNKISKIGLFIYLLNFILMIALILLNQKIPDYMVYVFWVSLVITIAGAIINKRKNQLL